jgi:hypothetical protein
MTLIENIQAVDDFLALLWARSVVDHGLRLTKSVQVLLNNARFE